MDKNMEELYRIKMEKTKAALEKNNMECEILENKEAVVNYLKEHLEEGCSVSVGGSQTLFECNVIDLLREMPVKYDDRYQEGLSRKEQREVFRRAFLCDYYISSSNAVTMNGELYNIDGTSNRVAAISFGPDKVILVVGRNKIVKDLEEAQYRVRNIAAVANCIRLNKDTPCVKVGHCVDCQNENRICATFVVHRRQNNKNRIKVLLVNEDLGY